jgi:hypothetical protein
MYVVRLIGIMRVGDVPDEFRGFVEFQGRLEQRHPADDELVALLIVEGTESIFPVFLKDLDLSVVEETLRKQETAIPPEVKRELSTFLAR